MKLNGNFVTLLVDVFILILLYYSNKLNKCVPVACCCLDFAKIK